MGQVLPTYPGPLAIHSGFSSFGRKWLLQHQKNDLDDDRNRGKKNIPY